MLDALKRLSLGLALIGLASAVLLVSDAAWFRGHNKLPRVAILQHASNPVLDEGVRGMIDGLAETGWKDGETVEIDTYNAQGEIAAATSIVGQILNGHYDLVLTSSTPSLQAMANANRDG